MYAAPTAQSDFTILTHFHSLNWKQQLNYLDSLTQSLQNQNVCQQQIQICLLAMLQQKNMNVLIKVLKLIKKYIGLFGITVLSFREFVHCLMMVSVAAHSHVIVEIIEAILQKAVKNTQQAQDIVKGLNDSHNSGVSQEYITKIINSILASSWGPSIITESILQQLLQILMTNNNFREQQQISEAETSLLQLIVQIFSSNSILYARKLKFATGYITKLKQILKAENNRGGESIVQKQINYVYDIASEEWLEDYDTISIKSLLLSLKRAIGNNENQSNTCPEYHLNTRLIESFRKLSHRKNKNLNKYIYDIVSGSITRHNVRSNQQALFLILFECLADKRVCNKLKNQSVTNRESIWLGIITEETVNAKIQASSLQEEYHRLIMLLSILQTHGILQIHKLCKKMQEKENISTMYRLQVDQLTKL